jgi:hypothetical protein
MLAVKGPLVAVLLLSLGWLHGVCGASQDNLETALEYFDEVDRTPLSVDQQSFVERARKGDADAIHAAARDIGTGSLSLSHTHTHIYPLPPRHTYNTHDTSK